MNNRTKVIVGVIVALFALSLIIRFVVLSQAGFAGYWIFYLGLPVGGLVTVLFVLLRLGVLNFGDSPSATVQHWQHRTAAPGSAPVSSEPSAPTSQRLQELETLRTNGTISDTEYAAKRAKIISGI
jgi:hypothetical protein